MIPSLEFTRNFVELNHSQHYTLSIRITPDGFCFCILDNSQKKFIFLKNVVSNPFSIELLQQQINIEPIFNYPVARVVIACCTPHYTLLPLVLFDESKKDAFFTFNQPLQEGETIWHEEIQQTSIVNICSAPDNILRFLRSKFPQASILHQGSILIADAVRQSAKQQAKQLHIDVYSGFFYANIADNGSLIFSNSFTFGNPDEFVFFIISLFDRFGLGPLNTHLFLSGNISKTGAETGMLKSYIQHIVFAETPGYSFIPPFLDISHHELSKLFVSCEL